MAHERRTQAYSVVFTKVMGILQIHGLPFPRARTLPFSSIFCPQNYWEHKEVRLINVTLSTQPLTVQRFDAKQNYSTLFCPMPDHDHFDLARPFESSKRAPLTKSTTCKFTELHANELNKYYASIAIHRLWSSWITFVRSRYEIGQTVNNNEREISNWNWFFSWPMYTNTNAHSYRHRSQSRLISD